MMFLVSGRQPPLCMHISVCSLLCYMSQALYFLLKLFEKCTMQQRSHIGISYIRLPHEEFTVSLVLRLKCVDNKKNVENSQASPLMAFSCMHVGCWYQHKQDSQHLKISITSSHCPDMGCWWFECAFWEEWSTAPSLLTISRLALSSLALAPLTQTHIFQRLHTTAGGMTGINKE